LATDNDLNEDIARGVRRRFPGVEVISIRDVGLARANDAGVSEWGAQAGYVVLTHDISTMTAAAYQRLRKGEPLAGVVVVPQLMKIGEAVRSLEDHLRAGGLSGLAGRVTFLKRP
jgi:Domain of unknown function (DUF5615)